MNLDQKPGLRSLMRHARSRMCYLVSGDEHDIPEASEVRRPSCGVWRYDQDPGKSRGKLRRTEQGSELTLENAPRTDLVERLTEVPMYTMILRFSFSLKRQLHI